MRVVWQDDALWDLKALRRYIARESPGAAMRVSRRIRASVRMLARSPGIGRPGRYPGTRELVITGTPYIAAYRVRGDVIEILRVLHGAMQWPGEM